MFRLMRHAKKVVATIALGTAFAFPAAQAAEFPEKPVTLVVWSGAGGALDVYGRKLAELLEKQAGWTVKVENRPGGTGAVGMSAVLTQPADGYNILVHTGALTFGIAQGLIPFKLEDLRFLRAMQSEPSSLAVRADSPFQSAEEFIAHMKANPNGLRVGGHAPGGFHQYMLYQLMQQGEFESGWIPHDASGKVALALMGGHIDAAMMTPSSGLAQVEAGQIRLLGISTEERSDYFPDTPTFKEQGYDLVDEIWRGIAVKAGTPDEAVNAIQKAIDKVTASPEWQTFQADQKQESPDWQEDEFTANVGRQLDSQAAFLKAAGITQ
nr:tripartite tricarboxylate transporter substrate binding protein [Stappia sp. P2PMeth1]